MYEVAEDDVVYEPVAPDEDDEPLGANEPEPPVVEPDAYEPVAPDEDDEPLGANEPELPDVELELVPLDEVPVLLVDVDEFPDADDADGE